MTHSPLSAVNVPAAVAAVMFFFFKFVLFFTKIFSFFAVLMHVMRVQLSSTVCLSGNKLGLVFSCHKFTSLSRALRNTNFRYLVKP